MTDSRKLDLQSCLTLTEGRQFWLSNSVASQVKAQLQVYNAGATLAAVCLGADEQPSSCQSLVVVGGGRLIDRAKSLKVNQNICDTLLAIPSVWGSGAEVSAIAVTQDGLKKKIEVGPEFLPDHYCHWPDLADSLSFEQKLSACGDVWAHLIEAFLSPLASPELQATCASQITRMSDDAAIDGSPALWFDWSAKACELQAQSSVGLVHGIAHTVEYPFASEVGRNPGHARLCGLLLAPVMRFNLQQSEKARQRFANHKIDTDKLLETLDRFYDRDLFTSVTPFIKAHWKSILRDQCTRTNVSLVRRNHLDLLMNCAP